MLPVTEISWLLSVNAGEVLGGGGTTSVVCAISLSLKFWDDLPKLPNLQNKHTTCTYNRKGIFLKFTYNI